MAKTSPEAITIDHPTPGRIVEINAIDHVGARSRDVGIVVSSDDAGRADVDIVGAKKHGDGWLLCVPYLASGLTEPSDDGRLAFSWRYPPRSDRKLEIDADGRVKKPVEG